MGGSDLLSLWAGAFASYYKVTGFQFSGDGVADLRVNTNLFSKRRRLWCIRRRVPRNLYKNDHFIYTRVFFSSKNVNFFSIRILRSVHAVALICATPLLISPTLFMFINIRQANWFISVSCEFLFELLTSWYGCTDWGWQEKGRPYVHSLGR